jgi:hypothetical protein
MHDEMKTVNNGAVSADAPHGEHVHDEPVPGDVPGDGEPSDEMLSSIAGKLREPVTASAGFDEWVMAEIRAGEADRNPVNPSALARTRSWVSRRAEWLATGALLTIAAVTIVVLRMTVQVPVTPEHDTRATHAQGVVSGTDLTHGTGVRFTFSAPEAQSVTVAGTFNGWDTHATPLHREAGGVWSVSVPLDAGRYAYMFVVDGKRWVLDPSAARDASDDFGTPNSVVMVASATREL